MRRRESIDVLYRRLREWEGEAETKAHGFGPGVAERAIAVLRREIHWREQHDERSASEQEG